MGKDIVLFDLFIASDIWRRTSQRPALVYDENRDRITFVWPFSTEVKDAIEKHLSDKKIKQYIELYKSLRSEMYLLKNKNGGEK